MTYSLGALTLDVKRENVRDNANLDIMAMPMSGRTATLAFDFNGAQAEITIDCLLKSTSIANLATLIGTYRALLNGNQTAIVFVSDAFGTANVKISDVSFSRSIEENGLLTVMANIKLIQCDSTV